MNSKPTAGTWEAVPDPHNASNPYWHVVDIHAGPLLVARVQCTNAQRQGPANAAILAAASDLLTAAETLLYNMPAPRSRARMAEWQALAAVVARIRTTSC